MRPRPPWAWNHRPLAPLEAVAEDGAERGPCLVHLVRKVNGTAPPREFVECLRTHPPGIEHELVFAMKGFSSPEDAKPYLEGVQDLAPRVLFFPDRHFDLGVYFATAARLRRERYCFTNSNARPLVDGWLAKLSAALDRPGVGQVGATGAWTSQHSWLKYSMGLPSVYRGLIPPPPVARKLLMEIELERYWKDHRSRWDSVQARLRTLSRIPEELLGFEPFPTYHLRPNSFMITHIHLAKLRLFSVKNKMDTYAIESSRESITRQLQRRGLASLVVDRAGSVYPPEKWDRSRVFWQGDQEGLLVADNQTLYYANGNAERRKLLAMIAWGTSADPTRHQARYAMTEQAA